MSYSDYLFIEALQGFGFDIRFWDALIQRNPESQAELLHRLGNLLQDPYLARQKQPEYRSFSFLWDALILVRSIHYHHHLTTKDSFVVSAILLIDHLHLQWNCQGTYAVYHWQWLLFLPGLDNFYLPWIAFWWRSYGKCCCHQKRLMNLRLSFLLDWLVGNRSFRAVRWLTLRGGLHKLPKFTQALHYLAGNAQKIRRWSILGQKSFRIDDYISLARLAAFDCLRVAFSL